MSASLLRKGLDLLSPDGSGPKKSSGSNQKVPLSSHKTGMKKQLKRLKRQGVPQKEKATAKGRVIKSAVEEFKKNSTKDYLAQNMKYMLESHQVASKTVVKNILKQNIGRKAKDQRVKQQSKVQQKSVFSDADFKRFEKEYFGNR
ncbi:active regulator of SIRT1 [Spea bombifrons]|uniref:active regulator of SIRT1 n=1 Tax=Spea bombifrons TaxID=233779 RepID=UPI00234AFAC8|nr:active regulator of SIRT1 [Spea bombifrons]